MKLKVKMLKKVISVLCSVVMSTSVLITSVGAVDGKKENAVYKKNPLRSNGAFTIKKPVNGFDHNKSVIIDEDDILRNEGHLDFGEFDNFENLSEPVSKASGKVDNKIKNTKEKLNENLSIDKKNDDANFDESISLDLGLIESFNKNGVSSNSVDEDNVNLGNSFDSDMGLSESIDRIKKEKNKLNSKGNIVLDFSEFSDLDMELSESIAKDQEDVGSNDNGEDCLNFSEFSRLDMELSQSIVKDKIESSYEDGDVVNLGGSFDSKTKQNEVAVLKEKKQLPKLFKKKIINSKKVLTNKSQKNIENVFKKKIIKSNRFFNNKTSQNKNSLAHIKAAEKIQAIWKGYDFRKKEDQAYAMVILYDVLGGRSKKFAFDVMKNNGIVKNKVSGARIYKFKS